MTNPPTSPSPDPSSRASARPPAAPDTRPAYRSDRDAGTDGFAQLLRSEWTKLRTVRAWVVALAAAAALMVFLSVLGAAGNPSSGGPPPIGPEGEQVIDSIAFVTRPLEGDGTITARVTSLTGMVPPMEDGEAASFESEPWAKAGLVVRAGTAQGSPYAAIMTTPGHGTRMQTNYLHDTAGSADTVADGSPRWLRLTRAGDVITGSESTDGTTWTDVGTAQLEGLPATVPVGLFVASPEFLDVEETIGGVSARGGFTEATGVFDHVDLQGRSSSDEWAGGDVGGPTTEAPPGTRGRDEQVPADSGRTTRVAVGPDRWFARSASGFVLHGYGDLAPATGGPGPNTIERALLGTFAALIVVVVLAASFITGEYRRGLIHTTLAASPRRGRVLAAKATVIGGATFVAGLVASVVSVAIVGQARGDAILPTSLLTQARVVVGTAALFAVAAVLALAVAAILRRSAGSVTAVIVLIVVPYIVAVSSVLPAGATNWILRVTPAAGFAIQQSVPEYAHVDGVYLPATGYYPLAPAAGFAVLCAWAALALCLATFLLRRRDA